MELFYNLNAQAKLARILIRVRAKSAQFNSDPLSASAPVRRPLRELKHFRKGTEHRRECGGRQHPEALSEAIAVDGAELI